MPEIGPVVLRNALEFCAEVRELVPNFQVGVNLSIIELTQPGLLRSVQRPLDRYGLSPDALVFEITETTYSTLLDADAAACLQQLVDAGISLDLDDFGTGYSSLLRAKNYPVSGIKIDQAFTAGIAWEGDVNRGIVATIRAGRSPPPDSRLAIAM